jgi:hypothetical protein
VQEKKCLGNELPPALFIDFNPEYEARVNKLSYERALEVLKSQNVVLSEEKLDRLKKRFNQE